MDWSYFRLVNLPVCSRTVKMVLHCLCLALLMLCTTDAQPSESIKNTISGVYSENITLFFMNSPYRVDKDLTVETGATMTIQTGVKIYFDAGVGLKIKGSLYAVGSKFARIQFLPYQSMLNYDYDFPKLRLVDGPNVRQGRLQVLFKDRWRSVCTQQTNWTATDLSVACQSMGYGGGGFWRWFLRNNDTMPFVLPKPRCNSGSKTLWDCPAFVDDTRIPLSENLCQGEDDLGLYCWGPPSYSGWGRHWKGLQFLHVPFEYVNSDADHVAVHRQSLSRLEYVNIHYAGYDATTKNTTAALWVQGVPPFMNGLDVQRSARDGIFIYEATGPILIANSTITYNRGHGIVVENTTDGRVFINETAIEHNYGDGVWYRHKGGNQLQLILQSLSSDSTKWKRQTSYYEEERPRVDICRKHEIPSDAFFPHLIRAFLSNGTLLEPEVLHPCWLTAALPPRLAYTFTLQFISIVNLNAPGLGTKTALIVCEPNEDANGCAVERYRIPIFDGIIPQSLSVRSAGHPIYIALQHNQSDKLADGRVWGDVDVQFRIYATVEDKAFYGLNISNSRIVNNTGSGVYAQDVRDRTVLTNVTITHNQGYAGLLVRDGAGDIWINDTRLDENWGDGINVSYVGGSITVNGTSMSRNRMRGAAFHQNTSSHFLSLHQEIIFKGRPSNNNDYLQTVVADNLWGGILVGNFCISLDNPIDQPKVLISYVEFLSNHYHPAFEYHSCQMRSQPLTHVDFTGSRCERGVGMCLRVLPAVNVRMVISSNQFLNNNGTALLIRNRDHPQLKHLPADVTVSKNSFKFNTAQFIVSIGLNEDGVDQALLFNQQNEIRENRVVNPYPLLKPRSTPYAALIVSSSNVVLRRNCFKNAEADYEIATDLPEHAKWIDAKENNWGYQTPDGFMPRIFDQFNRYSLASIDVNPYAAVCNQRNPHISLVQQYFRQFRLQSQPFVLGGAIYENQDLSPGQYLVTEDLHVVPGAKLSIAPGAVLQFEDGVGMLVQGELTRTDFSGSDRPVTFTRKPFEIPVAPRIRLMNDQDIQLTTEGRLEIELNGEWGTVCNRSWTVKLAMRACSQLGLAMDPEYLENWLTYPHPGSLPMLMDNIRCEEMEYDITQCRHDGRAQNINSSCPSANVVGLRCVEPRWAGVRFSLLASPPTVTGQSSMNNWIIEKAGLFDFSVPLFSAALQIDWNYHSFHSLIIRDNFWTGFDVVYNDLTKKPAIRDSRFERNRRHGIKLRSIGLTISDVVISDNENAGVRYNPIVSPSLQRDIVTWLERREESEMEANNVFIIPKKSLTKVDLFESQLNHRKFLLARPTADCPIAPLEPCNYELTITAEGFEFGLASRVGVQIVNRPGNESDENAVFVDVANHKEWDVRKDLIHFPVISTGGKLTMRYTRSYGQPALVVLLLFFDSLEYIDRFVHIYKSQITDNQYGVSTLHYSNFSHSDGSVLNRWAHEKLWFQKVNFTRNSQAVIWVNGPLQDVHDTSPIAQIEYHIDNCSVSVNNGSIIETHRDLHSSANVFKWKVWSCTFAGNINSGFSIALPDTFDLLAKETHSVEVTENRFINNRDFQFELAGYYAFVNISSNNFTENRARMFDGLLHIRGMEKRLVLERNRFILNKGHWVIKYDIQSQSIRNNSETVPALIQFNYFMSNYLLNGVEDTVDRWPRSYCVGVFGSQKVEVHYNRLSNLLLDFELVSGVIGSNITETMNVSYNWWGTGNEAEILQRVFDFDDWNIYTLADYNPYFVTEEQFIDWWWLRLPSKGQLANVKFVEPSPQDLKGRMYQSVTLQLVVEQWHDFPYHYKPYRPYRISKDLTIMPGATLTIEKGVEVHIWPNVRILVLGNLKAEGTLWEPIRFKPINTTEYEQIEGVNLRRWKRSENPMFDSIYRQFPLLKRQDSFYQKFKVFMLSSGTEKMPERSGFIEIYNATTGEMVPLCDRQFTRRNAEVVCRELGYETSNVYHWVTPRWDYNPLIRIIRSYAEPRQCMGTEERLSDCDLRLNGDVRQWQCVDSEHFVFVHCGPKSAVNKDYIGHWGGITFSAPSLEASMKSSGESILRHVEIVGAGYAHNDTTSSAALQMIYRTPVLDNVNITNSSMHGVQIIAPRSKVLLNFLNITDNRGQGLNILTTNLQSSVAPSGAPFGNITAPYHMFGLVDLCSAGKEIRLESRILVYYKYDSYQVDCVKYFVSENPARKVGFRVMQANFYDPHNPVGRPDSLRFYDGRSFAPNKMIADLRVNEPESARMIQSSSSILGIHLRATAADGRYGFIAEVAALPSAPDTEPVQEVTVRHSRFLRNDRGAFGYRSAGEASPNLIVEQCFFADNGYHLWGNLSTSEVAVELDLHNTQLLRFQSNMLWRNQGGLAITAQSTSSIARLSGLIKDSVFVSNEKFVTLSLQGRDFQKVYLINNMFSKNRARYYDTVFVDRMTANFTHNYFFNNTGTHTIDLTGYPQVRTESQTFINNFLYENIALGHGFQYPERYGYLPEIERSEQHQRSKRQIEQIAQHDDTTFDWWAHVGGDTRRHRTTVLAGSAQQQYSQNFFSNPKNDFELTTVNRSVYDVTIGAIDARYNYWGYPGTAGVAAGKIRDWEDYNYLIKVDYLPVLESNTSLIQGDCPAGWFQAGVEEYKSCFLFVGASMPYAEAVTFCQEQDSFIPYFMDGDVRQRQVAERINLYTAEFISDIERFSGSHPNYETRVWVSGVSIPSTQCGWMSSSSGNIGLQNCQLMLPFVCEKGTKPYQEPFLWRGAGLFALFAVIFLLLLLGLLIALWYCKSKRRSKQHYERKMSLRKSLRASKLERERHENQKHENQRREVQMRRAQQQQKVLPADDGQSSPDLIRQAHRNLVLGRSHDSLSTSGLHKTASKDSLSTTVTDDSSATYGKKSGTTKTYSESAYRSDYSPTESYFTESRTSSRHHVVPTPNLYSEITAPQPLNSFMSPAKKAKPVAIPSPVKFRQPVKGSRRDTDLSQMSSTTYCSTCPTATNTDSVNESRESTITEEGSSWAGTETASVRSTLTDVTTPDARALRPLMSVPASPTTAASSSNIFTRPKPIVHANSESGLSEDPRDYLQGALYTPTRDFDRRAAGLIGNVPLRTPPRPGRPPPLPPPGAANIPNYAYADSSLSQDSLINATAASGNGRIRRPEPPPTPAQPLPSRSLVDLHTPNWHKPHMSSFSLASRSNSEDRPAPIETAM